VELQSVMTLRMGRITAENPQGQAQGEPVQQVQQQQ